MCTGADPPGARSAAPGSHTYREWIQRDFRPRPSSTGHRLRGPPPAAHRLPAVSWDRRGNTRKRRGQLSWPKHDSQDDRNADHGLEHPQYDDDLPFPQSLPAHHSMGERLDSPLPNHTAVRSKLAVVLRLETTARFQNKLKNQDRKSTRLNSSHRCI